jgi:hypothetical protein
MKEEHYGIITVCYPEQLDKCPSDNSSHTARCCVTLTDAMRLKKGKYVVFTYTHTHIDVAK